MQTTQVLASVVELIIGLNCPKKSMDMLLHVVHTCLTPAANDEETVGHLYILYLYFVLYYFLCSALKEHCRCPDQAFNLLRLFEYGLSSRVASAGQEFFTEVFAGLAGLEGVRAPRVGVAGSAQANMGSAGSMKSKTTVVERGNAPRVGVARPAKLTPGAAERVAVRLPMEPDDSPRDSPRSVEDHDDLDDLAAGAGNDDQRDDDELAESSTEEEVEVRRPQGSPQRSPTRGTAHQGSPQRSPGSVKSPQSPRMKNTGPRVAPSITPIPWPKFEGGDDVTGRKGIQWSYDEEMLLFWAQNQFYDGKSLFRKWELILVLYRDRFHPERDSRCLTSKYKGLEKQVNGFGLDRLYVEQAVRLKEKLEYAAFIEELREQSGWDLWAKR
jgi:hypothetical protein